MEMQRVSAERVEMLPPTPPTLTSIEAVFTQPQQPIVDTDSLDELKQWLVVTATFSDSSTRVLDASEYTLSGTLEYPSSTITVDYQGVTDTFTVAVTSSVVNLWNMNFASASNPGFNSSSKVIASDGTFTITNGSGASTARIQLSMSAANLGLEDGKTYTVKVWAVENDISSSRNGHIYTNGSYVNVYGPAPVSKTWVQSGGNQVQVGFLYWQDYSNGSRVSLRVMVAEGDHIDDYMPYSS